MASKPRVKLPVSAKPGEIITIKTLISHRMESGLRKDEDGEVIPRMIINTFSCTFNGRPVFTCDLNPAVAADPFLEFKARITEAGTFSFIWLDDDGHVFETTQAITLI